MANDFDIAFYKTLGIVLNGGPGSGNFNPGQGRGVGKPSNGNNHKSLYSNVSEKYHKSFVEKAEKALKEVEDEFGLKINVNLRHIDDYDDSAEIKEQDYIGWTDHRDSDNINIVFSKDFSDNLEKFIKEKEIDDDLVDSSVKGIIKHELGHALIAQIAKNSTKTIEEATEKYDELNKEIFNRSLKEIGGQFALQMYMSPYGQTSEEDFVAESISKSDYSKLTKKASEIVKEIIDKSKKS